MKLHKTLILDSVQEHDLEVIEGAWEEVLSLIEQNPFQERVSFLLAHQEISDIEVMDKRGIMQKPNCIGTALFIAGTSPFDHPHYGYSSEMNPHMEGQPGERGLIDMFRTFTERRISGAFVFSLSHYRESSWHAGIYLGQIGSEHILFAQHGYGEKFGLETLARNYYLPPSLFPSLSPTPHQT